MGRLADKVALITGGASGIGLATGQLMAQEGAVVVLTDLQDGTEKWGEWSLGKGSLIMSADGRMIIMSDKGELVTAKADPSGFTVLTRTQLLPRSKCWTTPALSNGKIYARNAVGDAACVDVSKK